MKTKDFERILVSLGFRILKESGHRIWANGKRHVAVPRAKEINKMMARRLLKEMAYSEDVSELDYRGATHVI